MTTIITHSAAQHHDSCEAPPAASKAVAVSGLVSVSAPSYRRMLNRDGRHIAGINGVFPGSVKATFGSHQFTRCGVDQGFLLPWRLPIATALTLAPTAISHGSLTGRKTSKIAGHAPFVLTNGPEGLIMIVVPDRVSELGGALARQDLSLGG